MSENNKNGGEKSLLCGMTMGYDWRGWGCQFAVLVVSLRPEIDDYFLVCLDDLAL